MEWVKALKKLFESKYVLIYTAFGDDECIRIVGKLQDAGVFHKTKIRGIFAGGVKRSSGFATQLSQYDIYVLREDEHKGYVAIHTGN